VDDDDFESIRRGVEFLDLTQVQISSSAIAVVSAEIAHEHQILPVWYQEGILTLAIGEVDLDLMHHLMFLLPVEAIEFRLGRSELIGVLIRRHYRDS